MTPEDTRIARNSILLAAFPPEVRDAVMDSARLRSFDRGATIFLQGEAARAVFVVIDGWVKLYRIAPSGLEAVVGVFTRGRSFGEAAALRDDVYPVAAEAVTDCRLVRIEAATLLRLVRGNPEVALAIVAATFVHLHSLVGQVEALKARTGAQRVAEFLLDLCACQAGACTVTLPYDKSLIAGRLGMKPESLSRAFARLKQIGVSVRNNQAAISDVEDLRDFAGEEPGLPWSRAQ